MSWTNERVARLIELWTDGYSASQCAKALGDDVTRNAVIGKVHRLKLPVRLVVLSAPRSNVKWSEDAKARAARRAAARKSRPRVVHANRPPPMPVEPVAMDAPAWEALPGTTPISLVDLTNDTCRWPIGDPLEPGFAFCGCQVQEGSSYCSTHRARSIGPGTSNERHAPKALRVIAHRETHIPDMEAA